MRSLPRILAGSRRALIAHASIKPHMGGIRKAEFASGQRTQMYGTEDSLMSPQTAGVQRGPRFQAVSSGLAFRGPGFGFSGFSTVKSLQTAGVTDQPHRPPIPARSWGDGYGWVRTTRAPGAAGRAAKSFSRPSPGRSTAWGCCVAACLAAAPPGPGAPAPAGPHVTSACFAATCVIAEQTSNYKEERRHSHRERGGVRPEPKRAPVLLWRDKERGIDRRYLPSYRLRSR